MWTGGLSTAGTRESEKVILKADGVETESVVERANHVVP